MLRRLKSENEELMSKVLRSFDHEVDERGAGTSRLTLGSEGGAVKNYLENCRRIGQELPANRDEELL